ncbi:AbrB family transcriptional regulator [Terrihabitans sp. B22-R8]|uniref:AbrB family transcriptional regulator n=1 Tax=Terrihabitans sp. B22-R8 TaxID=3425128 RepID=UPI00403C264C
MTVPSFSSRITAWTIGLGIVGGLAAWAADLPAPWLMGPTIVVAIAAAAGLRAEIPMALETVMLILTGLTIGSGVSPEVLQLIPQWPISIAALMIVLVAMVLASSLFLHLAGGWDRNTAILASVPGVLPYVMSLAADKGADIRKVAFAQSLRVVLVVAALPLFSSGNEALLAKAPNLISHSDLALLLAAGIAGALLFRGLKVSGGLLLGALTASVLLFGSGSVRGEIPEWIVIPVTILLGCWVGSRFDGLAFRSIGRIFILSLMALAIMMVVAWGGAWATATLTGLPINQVLLGFAPGAVEITALLAFLFGVDPAFVAAHQVIRFVALTILLPVLVKSRQ